MVETSWYTPLSKRTSDITTSQTSSSWTILTACMRAPTPTVGITAHVAGAMARRARATHGTLRLREKAGCDKRAKRFNLNVYLRKAPGCHRPPCSRFCEAAWPLCTLPIKPQTHVAAQPFAK